MYQNVVVFALTLLLDLPQVLHRHFRLLSLRQPLHVVPEGFTEIFGYVFGVSFSEALAIYGGFLKEANFFILVASNPRAMLLVGAVLR